MSDTSTVIPIDLQTVISASGWGTRPWPPSRKYYAKQNLTFDEAAFMLQATINRLGSLGSSAPLVICNEESRFLAAEQMREIGQHEVLILLYPATAKPRRRSGWLRRKKSPTDGR